MNATSRSIFVTSSDGRQQNVCRDLILSHLGEPTLETARRIAERLRETTDGRSGLGLLFLIVGTEGESSKIVISRFPTDSAILVDEDSTNFSVAFLERVFMKNKYSYKAVAYEDSSIEGGFWTGSAIDKQINGRGERLSDYWIAEFLLSDFATTPAAGSQRLGKAIREAVNSAPVETKEELIAAAKLATGLTGRQISINSFADQFSLSSQARTALVGALKNPRTAADRFTLDIGEFRNYIAFRSIELDNGALLTAGTAEFETVFQRRYLDDAGDAVEYSTRGRIVDEKLRTRR